MSGKLDQSLDQIMKDTKPVGGRRGGRFAGKPRPARRAATKAKAAISSAAPTGGVQKNTKQHARSMATAPTAPATGDSKIIVSNLPEDVNETQIKDYFGKTIGPTKRVFLTYGPTGKSRGVATIIFANPTAAAKAARELDGVKVDTRAMRIEVVLGAKQAPVLPAPKSLADRVSKPKSAARDKPKSAAGVPTKANGATTNGAARGGPAGRGRKAGRAGRPKKKTADELDAEMVDYFGAGEGSAAAANGPAQPIPAVSNGDAGMVDEVM